MNPVDITPLILTREEALNLPRSLERLRWAREIIVLDSHSTDATRSIAESYPNVRFLERTFDDHTTQWNFGIDSANTPWILALDADYVLPDGFADEIRALVVPDDVHAYMTSFRYCIAGTPLRSTLYPPRAVLFRQKECRYHQDGHTQRLCIPGEPGSLQSIVDHDDRKPLSHWLRSQDRYACLEVQKLLAQSSASLGLADRLRLWIWPAPIITFIYCLLVRGLILDGWQGLYYTLQRTLAEVLLSLRLLEAKLRLVPVSGDSAPKR